MTQLWSPREGSSGEYHLSGMEKCRENSRKCEDLKKRSCCLMSDGVAAAARFGKDTVTCDGDRNDLVKYTHSRKERIIVRKHCVSL